MKPIYYAITGVLLIVAVLAIKGCRENKAMYSDMRAADSFNKYQIDYWKDEAGNEHARQETLEVENAALIAKADSIAHALGVKVKQLEGQTIVHTVIADQATVPVIKDPVTGLPTFGIDSAYWKLKGVIDSMGRVHISDTMLADISIVPYWQRKHKLLGIRYGQIQHYTDITSDNPALKITGATSYRIRVKEPSRWGLCVMAGVDISLRPTVAAGISYTFLRF